MPLQANNRPSAFAFRLMLSLRSSKAFLRVPSGPCDRQGAANASDDACELRFLLAYVRH